MQQPELSPCRSSFSDMKLHTDQRCEWPDLAMSQLTRYLTFRTCSTSLLLCVRDSFLNLLLSKRIWHSTASALLSGRFCVAASMSARSLADVCAFALACSALAGFPIVCPWPRCAETADTCRSNPSVLDIYRRMVACMGPTKLRHAGFATNQGSSLVLLTTQGMPIAVVRTASVTAWVAYNRWSVAIEATSGDVAPMVRCRSKPAAAPINCKAVISDRQRAETIARLVTVTKRLLILVLNTCLNMPPMQ